MEMTVKHMRIPIAFSLVALLALFAAAEEMWTMGAPRTWARDKDAIKLEKLSDGGFEVRYASDTDWCVNGFPRIDVKRGDMFEMTCETEALADAPGLSPVRFSAILRDESGKEVSWSFGGGHAKPGESVKTAFMVPRGVATIQPRILGRGAVGVRVRNLRVRRTGNILPASSVAHGGDVLSLFTYYSDFTIKVRHAPGEIVVRNCRLENAARFLHYNFSGNETWQKNKPLGSIRFEGVEAKNVGMSLCAYGDRGERLSLAFENCRVSFSKKQTEFVRGAHIASLVLRNVTAEGVDGPCVRSWGDVEKPDAQGLLGIGSTVEVTNAPFEVTPI